ncbi:NTP transferase domain-containing protein [Kozakia baliensis]|uniref:NTP transferase domain-containing protein n=1 Tax=Kozakia baliensis TaxID=153496 RepID=UPI00345C1E2E
MGNLTLPPLYGLVLSGGESQRMGQDKAGLLYTGRPQLARAFDLLAAHVDRCFVSLRQEQKDDPLRIVFPGIIDTLTSVGPAAGLLAAHALYPKVAWVVLACDLPLLEAGTLDTLIAARHERYAAIAFQSEHDGLPEPLCTIWEPAALEMLQNQRTTPGKISLRNILTNHDTRLLPAAQFNALENVNTPEERASVLEKIAQQNKDTA